MKRFNEPVPVEILQCQLFHYTHDNNTSLIQTLSAVVTNPEFLLIFYIDMQTILPAQPDLRYKY